MNQLTHSCSYSHNTCNNALSPSVPQYDVEFEMFDKVVIKGDAKSPLYQTLTEQTPEGIKGDVQWNFTKFLVDPQGHVVQRFESAVSPTDPAVTSAIEKVLPKA